MTGSIHVIGLIINGQALFMDRHNGMVYAYREGRSYEWDNMTDAVRAVWRAR